jgi:hypothetical protein
MQSYVILGGNANMYKPGLFRMFALACASCARGQEDAESGTMAHVAFGNHNAPAGFAVFMGNHGHSKIAMTFFFGQNVLTSSAVAVSATFHNHQLIYGWLCPCSS